ncbi:MAG: M23 family metallopeptidase [Lachnospiraceae bacterium]|nr:M23 family metallopeptidase [Lachnospiraceae bacterium]
MKNQRHKRKESYSILLISNTGRTSRQFQLSTLALRFILIIALLTCTVTGLFAYTYSTEHKVQSALRAELSEQEQLVQTLTAEAAALKEEQQVLTEENEALKRESEQYAEEAKEAAAAAAAMAEEAEEKEPESDSTLPSRYPSSGASILSSSYSEEQPYLTITTYAQSTIVAAGDGTVTAVASDDIYHHIIEIEHESGYKTRYLCRQEATAEVEEGAQVQAGDLLLTITTDDTQMDYQVLNAEGPVDPLSVIDAKG